MRKHTCRNLGFTLVELMVVIGIIAMLAAIALPNFKKVREKARDAQVVRNLDTIRKGLEQFAVDHNGMYPYRVRAFDSAGGREMSNTDEDGYAPMGIWGGAEVTDARGAPLPDVWETKPVSPAWNQDPLMRYSLFNQHSDPLKVYGYITSYPENPFLKRPMGGVLWAFSGIDITIPSPDVIVLAGDFVYTYNMGDPVDPTSGETSDRNDPASVIPAVDTYQVTYLNAMPLVDYRLDVVDSYQLWGYGTLPMNGPFYAVYSNNSFAAPTKVVRARKDWNGNGASDEFEKGIVMYFSGGKKFFEEKTSTGQKIEY
jgi:prepilin-type N-terminal cleavage/methylation domain-containing protein